MRRLIHIVIGSFLALPLCAQPSGSQHFNIFKIGGTTVASDLYDTTNHALKVICVASTCTGGGGTVDVSDRVGRLLGVAGRNWALASGTDSVTVANLSTNTAQETGGNLDVIRANQTNGQQVVRAPPPLTTQQLSNPLLRRAAMKTYCQLNICTNW